MFACKARDFLIEERSLPIKHKSRLDRPAREKHSGLLGKLVNYDRKKSYNFGPWSACPSFVSFLSEN
jgi:hypothetical protein